MKSGRGKRSVEDVVTALQKGASNDVQICSVHEFAQSLDMPVSTAHKITCSISHSYPYIITHIQELLPADLRQRQMFAPELLACMEVDNE